MNVVECYCHMQQAAIAYLKDWMVDLVLPHHKANVMIITQTHTHTTFPIIHCAQIMIHKHKVCASTFKKAFLFPKRFSFFFASFFLSSSFFTFVPLLTCFLFLFFTLPLFRVLTRPLLPLSFHSCFSLSLSRTIHSPSVCFPLSVCFCLSLSHVSLSPSPYVCLSSLCCPSLAFPNDTQALGILSNGWGLISHSLQFHQGHLAFFPSDWKPL